MINREIPIEIEKKYLQFQKLGFRMLFILFNNITHEYFVSIIPPSWCKQREWLEVIKSNE